MGLLYRLAQGAIGLREVVMARQEPLLQLVPLAFSAQHPMSSKLREQRVPDGYKIATAQIVQVRIAQHLGQQVLWALWDARGIDQRTDAFDASVRKTEPGQL